MFGLIVKAVGPPVTTEFVVSCVPLVPQLIENQFPATFTGSLKVMLTFALAATLVAPLVGTVLLTEGAVSGPPPQAFVGLAVFRGLGAPALKSVAF